MISTSAFDSRSVASLLALVFTRITTRAARESQVLGVGFKVMDFFLGFWFMVYSLWFMVYGSLLIVYDFRFRVSGFRVKGCRFRGAEKESRQRFRV